MVERSLRFLAFFFDRPIYTIELQCQTHCILGDSALILVDNIHRSLQFVASFTIQATVYSLLIKLVQTSLDSACQSFFRELRLCFCQLVTLKFAFHYQLLLHVHGDELGFRFLRAS